MNHGSDDEVRTAIEASEWHEKLAKGDTEDQQKFVDWICDAPDAGRLREFLRMQVLERDLKEFDFNKELDGEALIAAAAAKIAATAEGAEGRAVADCKEKPGVPAPMASHRPQRPKVLAPGVAAAVIAALIFGGVFLYQTRPSTDAWKIYDTARGIDGTFTLDDGSEMYMSPGSSVHARFNPARRDVDLVIGEALFAVKRAERWPFRVHVGGTVIQAVGTQFHVALRPDRTIVKVIEGKVQIFSADNGANKTSQTVSAGGTATVLADGTVMGDESQRSASMSVNRRGDPLIFHGSRLDDVAEAFNKRGWQVPRLVVKDGARSQTLFAIVPPNDPELLFRILKSQPGLEMTKEDGTVVIRLRDEAGHTADDSAFR